MTIAISGQYELEALWTDESTPDTVFAVVKIDRAGLKFDDDKQTWSATMKLSHIEPMVDEISVGTAAQLLLEAARERGGAVITGDVELDIPAAEEDTDAAESDMDVPAPDIEGDELAPGVTGQWSDDQKPVDQ